MTMARLEFASDYMEGCIPEILTRLTETNLEKSSGYGSDEHTARAAKLATLPTLKFIFSPAGPRRTAR